MLQFCRRKQGRVTMFLLVFLLLISIPMIGGSANCERIRRMAASVIPRSTAVTHCLPQGSRKSPERRKYARSIRPVPS